MNKTNEFKKYLIENVGSSYVRVLDKILNDMKINMSRELNALYYTHLGLVDDILNTIEDNSVDFNDPNIISYTLAYVISVKDKFGIIVWWCDDRQYYLITNKLISPSTIKNNLNESKLYLIDKDGKAIRTAFK